MSYSGHFDSAAQWYGITLLRVGRARADVVDIHFFLFRPFVTLYKMGPFVMGPFVEGVLL